MENSVVSFSRRNEPKLHSKPGYSKLNKMFQYALFEKIITLLFVNVILNFCFRCRHSSCNCERSRLASNFTRFFDMSINARSGKYGISGCMFATFRTSIASFLWSTASSLRSNDVP